MSNILIVDDDPVSCLSLEALLSPYGHLQWIVHSAKEALLHLAKAPTDLIITDVMMPEVDGFELCRRLKEHREWRYIPIIIVTALDDEGDFVRGFEAGADEFLAKPINKLALRARVRVLLRIRQQYKDLLGRQVGDVEGLIRRRVDELAQEVHLSAREREVLNLLLLGRNGDEIGTVLSISPRTAKFHQANILQKLGVESRHELIRLFM